MRCPGCEFVSSDLRDICPRCYIDLRPHKKLLGLKITNAKASYDDLLAKQFPAGAKPKKKAAPASPKQPEIKTAPSKPATPSSPPKAAAPETEAPAIGPKKSFLSSFLSKLSKPAFKSADPKPSLEAAPTSDTPVANEVNTSPATAESTSTQVETPPEVNSTLTTEAPKQPQSPTPPVMDFSDPQHDINQLLDSIYDETEMQIEAILAGKSTKAQTVETTVAPPPVEEEPTVEFEFIEEPLDEVEEETEISVQAQITEPAKEVEPDILTEQILGLPMLASSSAPLILETVEADLLLPVIVNEPANIEQNLEEAADSSHSYQAEQEPVVEAIQETQETVEPKVPEIYVPEPQPAYQDIETTHEPLFPESSELIAHQQQPEYAFFDNPIPIAAPPVASVEEPAHVVEVHSEEVSAAIPTEETNTEVDDASQPEITFEPDSEHQEISGQEVLAQISEALAEPERPEAIPNDSEPAAPIEDDNRLNGHGALSLAEPHFEPLAPASPVDLRGATLSALELSESQVNEVNVIFDTLTKQSWVDDHDVELFGANLGVTTEKETMELLFDLTLKSLTDANVQKILEVDIAKSETRHVSAINLEQQLKRVEQQLSKQVVSLKGDPSVKAGHSEAPTTPNFVPQTASAKQRFVAVACDLLLVAFLSAIFTTVRAMAEESLPVGTATWTDLYIDFAPHLASFFMAFLVLLPIYTTAILLITGNTLGGLIGRIHILTSTGQEPNYANFILRGITLPASYVIPMLHIQDRLSHTFLSKDAFQLPVEDA